MVVQGKARQSLPRLLEVRAAVPFYACWEVVQGQAGVQKLQKVCVQAGRYRQACPHGGWNA